MPAAVNRNALAYLEAKVLASAASVHFLRRKATRGCGAGADYARRIRHSGTIPGVRASAKAPSFEREIVEEEVGVGSEASCWRHCWRAGGRRPISDY